MSCLSYDFYHLLYLFVFAHIFINTGITFAWSINEKTKDYP